MALILRGNGVVEGLTDLPAGSVTAADLASTLDLSSKNVTLPNSTKEVKAWINYDQTVPVLVDSYNVSSVSDNSTGNFTVNFTTEMSGTTYLALSSSAYSGTTRGGYFIGEEAGDRDKTTAHCKFKVASGSSAGSDSTAAVDIGIINILFME